MAIVSILLLAAFLMLVLFMAKRRTAAFVAGFFIVFPLTYRAIDVTYLDVFGPVFAREVNRYVGGNFAAPMFLYAALSLIVPLLILFPDRGERLRRLAARSAPYVAYHRYVANIALLGAVGILALLFANFVYVGTIPILQGIDRLEYERSAGIIHGGFYNLNFLINFFLGAFTVLPRLNGKAFDLRFAGIMVLLLLYWVVTGNRFSVFFVLVSFYFMPVAAVLMAQKTGRIAPDALRSVLQRLIVSRTTRVFGGLASVLLVGGLIANSYFNVRDYREPLVEIQERVLVQPVQLWANAWERVEFDEVDNTFNDHAWREILNPIDASRNSTIQYLMTLELGYFRSRELTEQEQSYNGGFPEVHFELFGAWLPLLTLPLAGLIAAWFLSLCLALLYRNRVVTSVLGIYLFFGISLHFTGGMMTFMLTPTYWVKIAAFLIAWIVEGRILGAAAELAKRRTAAPPPPPSRRVPRPA